MTDDHHGLTYRQIVALTVRRLLEIRAIPLEKVDGVCAVLGIYRSDIAAAEQLQYIQPVKETGRTRAAGRRNPGAAKAHTRNTATGYLPPVEGEPDEKRCAHCETVKPIAEFKRTNKGKRQDGTIRFGRDSLCRPCRLEYQRKNYVTIRQREDLAAIGIELADAGGLECVICGLPLDHGEAAVGVAVVAHADCASGRVLAEVVHIQLENQGHE